MNLQNICQKIIRWFSRSKDVKPKTIETQYSDLTPTTECDDKDVCCQALEWALQNDQIKNVALSGPYGSGKSSILRKFREQHADRYYYINISLASFPQSNDDTVPDKELIEFSILQQLFYCEPARTIPDSRFKRIKSLTSGRLFLWAIGLMLWVLICQVPLWFPEIHPRERLWWFIGWVVLSGLGIGHFSAKLMRVINGSKVSRLNIKNGEIELSKESDPSILNKHLDEILYFFEVTQYNVVIIEDLDRFDNPDIFTKLREINLLLNNSKQVERRIVFIYALRDDLFQDKNRTKFFDFIIPVIPVVNPMNANDVLDQKLKLTDISADLIDDIALYIDDMRLLKNICNEFFIYRGLLNKNLTSDKIFALIVYKNLFPEDFVALHIRQGMVYRIFEQLPIWIQSYVARIDDRLVELEEELKELVEEDNDRKVSETQQEIKRLKNEKIQASSWTLQQLLEKDKDIRLFEKKDPLPPNADLIVYLLRNGYITEDYRYYISLFHEGRLTRADYDFLLSIKNRRSLSFNHPLDRVENLLLRIRPVEFGYKEALNDALTDHLLTACSGWDERVSRYFGQLSDETPTSLMYIEHYLTVGSQRPKFVARLAKAWPRWGEFIESHIQQEPQQEIHLLLLLRHADIKDLSVQDKNHPISRYILSRQDFLNWVKWLYEDDPWQQLARPIAPDAQTQLEEYYDRIKQAIDQLNIRFADLEPPQGLSPILDHIYETGHYELTPEMITLFIQTKGKDIRVEDLQTAHYSTILASGCTPLIDRVEENIEAYIDEVFLPLETNIRETQEAIVRLLNNETVTDKQKKAIIQKEITRLDNITAVSDQTLWAELLRKDRVQPTWGNVVAYYEYTENVFDDDLTEFLNRPENYTELSLAKFNEVVEMEDELQKSLSLAILENDTLVLDSYTALLKSIPRAYSLWEYFSIENLAAEKVDVLIGQGFLSSSTENYDLLKTHFSPKHIALLEYHAARFDSFVEQFEFDGEDLLRILLSDVFSRPQKVQLIHAVDEELIIERGAICVLAARLLYEAQDQSELSFTLLEYLVRYATGPEQKVRLMLWHWDSIQNEDHITTLLKACGSPYDELTLSLKHPKFERTDYNELLAQKLMAVGYISSVSERKNIIRMNAKQR